MRKLFALSVLIFAVSCSSNNTSENSGDSASINTGNSAGISTIGLDTTHMDTAASKLIPDSTR